MKVGRIVGGLTVAFVALAAVGYFASAPDAPHKPVTIAPNPRDVALRHVQIDHLTWGNSGGAFVFSGVIVNTGKRGIKDPVIACSTFAQDGTMLDDIHRTIYRRIGPHGRLKVARFTLGLIHGQAHSAQCRIPDLTPQP